MIDKCKECRVYAEYLEEKLKATEAELARLTASLHYANTVCMEQKHVIDRLKEDAERLAYHCVKRNHFEQYTCQLCDAYADTIDEIAHDPDCDYKKHRQLMKELERK